MFTVCILTCCMQARIWQACFNVMSTNKIWRMISDPPTTQSGKTWNIVFSHSNVMFVLLNIKPKHIKPSARASKETKAPVLHLIQLSVSEKKTANGNIKNLQQSNV
ncbi:hypothetical protein ATANTOWER_032076 [Ataeniobius toweri]|uniref:Secreted protein n=1 Tax=Ataeniobius toweri TaxID=208326 RepID=A0ABU7BLJ8_9TELE|nr:hypothetical protein [Ataeniobius toweri]